jgi:hypothetical protein
MRTGEASGMTTNTLASHQGIEVGYGLTSERKPGRNRHGFGRGGPIA